ncbi:GTP pyrophosphokinase family protein [Plantibacter sp. CFBP 8804]|uniref:GTP pyrophosphokinase family protein n=1 Tax=Plantibacter sp. CFBP 8804 TaxID=2775270 RepID=UPI00177A7A0B|nr:GTP pyrophosphokinase family protein [Plantibacter sp. CFBP 8804]MBD8517310.1 GTP pyrophosphokinase family protein [Plantibacter sp. CFBP 8804]
MEQCPWSNRQLERLGTQIRDRSEPDPSLPSYSEVMLWSNDLATLVQKRIERIDWSPLLGDRVPEITSRPKTIDTLRDKLIRQGKTPLGRIGDIAGVRFEAEMTLSEQDAVAVAIAGAFDHRPEDAVRDLRADPHSGYRAVHLRLKLQRYVEVQVRTHLQGEWANLYEAAGDLWGRDIRYDGLPTTPAAARLVEALREYSSSTIARFEESYDLLQKSELALAEAAGHIERLVPRSRRERKLIEDYQEQKRTIEELHVEQSERGTAMRSLLSDARISLQKAKRGA